MNNVEELKSRLRIEHCVDIQLAIEMLSSTISEEIRDMDEGFVQACWDTSVKMEDSPHIIEDGDRTLYGIPVLFRRYGHFANLLGEFVLNQDQGQDITDEWVPQAAPKTLSILTALKGIVTQYLGEVSLEMKHKTGVSPAEVLTEANKTGESFQQTSRRLQHRARGLRIVKSDDPEP